MGKLLVSFVKEPYKSDYILPAGMMGGIQPIVIATVDDSRQETHNFLYTHTTYQAQ